MRNYAPSRYQGGSTNLSMIWPKSSSGRRDAVTIWLIAQGETRWAFGLAARYGSPRPNSQSRQDRCIGLARRQGRARHSRAQGHADHGWAARNRHVMDELPAPSAVKGGAIT